MRSLRDSYGFSESQLSTNEELLREVGRVSTTGGGGNRVKDPGHNTDPFVRERFPELDNFGWPPRGAEAERRSLYLQAHKHQNGTWPSCEETSRAIDHLVPSYPQAKVPGWFQNGVPQLTVAEVKEIYSAYVNTDAGPGVPWSSFGQTKDSVMQAVPQLLTDTVNRRLELLSKPISSSLGGLEMVLQGYCDPVKVFVKQEPHKRAKLDEGRVRIISSVSAADEIVDRVIFGAQNLAEIHNWTTCPSKAGIGFSTDQQQIEVWKMFAKKLFNDACADSDVSGMDVAWKLWNYIHEWEFRVKLAGADPQCVWSKVMFNRLYVIACSVFCLSDGTLVAKTRPFKMESGTLITNSGNSHQRNLLAILIGAEWAMSNGDDCFEQFVENAVAKYLKLGFVVTDYRKAVNDVVFCSNIIKDGKCIPENLIKGLYKILSRKTFDKQVYEQFLSEYRHSPRLGECLLVFEHVWGGVQINNGKISKHQEEGKGYSEQSEEGCESN
jgi:hypothetical protein